MIFSSLTEWYFYLPLLISSFRIGNDEAFDEEFGIIGTIDEWALDWLSSTGNGEAIEELPSTSPATWLASRLLFSEFTLRDPESDVGGVGLVVGQHGHGNPKWARSI